MKTTATGEYLTTAEVAELLGIARDKIIDWIAIGDLIAVNVALRAGGQPRWRIRRADLDAFLASRETEAAQ